MGQNIFYNASYVLQISQTDHGDISIIMGALVYECRIVQRTCKFHITLDYSCKCIKHIIPYEKYINYSGQ
jgi:hypothetical protein